MSRFGRLRTTEDVLFHRLAAALTMELTVVELADRLGDGGHRDDVSDFLRDCSRTARRHVTNLEAAFRLAGKEPWERPCPPIAGLIRDGEVALRRSSQAQRDTALLTTARGMFAFGASAYGALLDLAEAEGRGDVVVLLRENLDEQIEMSRSVGALAREVAVDVSTRSRTAVG